MKFILGLMFVLILSSCASKNEATNSGGAMATAVTDSTTETVQAPQKKIAYDGACASCVSKGQCKIKGDAAITHEHKDVIYCFSSVKEKEIFLKNIEKNIKKADSNWEKFQKRTDRNK